MNATRTTQIRSISVHHGFEEYFIPEGVGQNVPFFNHEVGAIVSVDEKGNGILKQLIVDGKEWP